MKRQFALALCLIFVSSAALSAQGKQDAKTPAVAVIKDGIQYVDIQVSPRAYATIVVQKGIPVRFNLKAKASSLNGCNSAIQIPAFGVTKRLAAGDNIVQFTPKTVGKIPYACWMNMITDTIVVVDDLATLKK